MREKEICSFASGHEVERPLGHQYIDSVWPVGWPGSWVRSVNLKYKSETHECVARMGLMSLTEGERVGQKSRGLRQDSQDR